MSAVVHLCQGSSRPRRLQTKKKKRKETLRLLKGQQESQIQLGDLRNHIPQEVTKNTSERLVVGTETSQTIEQSCQGERIKGRRGATEALEEEPNILANIVFSAIQIWSFIIVHLEVIGSPGDPLLAIGRARTGDSMLIPTGQKYKIEQSEEWNGLAVSRGEILEVHLPSTDVGCGGDLWVGFWVKQVLIHQHGDYVAVVKSLGCSDPDWARWLSNQFNRRVGTVHFCASRPCAVDAVYTLHVTRVRTFAVQAFDRAYMTSYTKRQIPKWTQEELEEMSDDLVDVTDQRREEEDLEEDQEKEKEGEGPLDVPTNPESGPRKERTS